MLLTAKPPPLDAAMGENCPNSAPQAAIGAAQGADKGAPFQASPSLYTLPIH